MDQWRVPTIDELASLLWGEAPAMSGLCKAHIPLEEAFRSVFGSHKEWFWSSSFDELNEKLHVIDFRDGFCGKALPSCKGLVRLVKNSLIEPSWKCGNPSKLRYEDLGNATVLDHKTGLIWTKEAFLKERVEFTEIQSLLEKAKQGKAA